MKKNKKGFTLAELLIVVAIIAVLVAIAIPVFTAQLEKSRESTDLANLRTAYAAVVVQYLEGGSSTSAIVSAQQTQANWQTAENSASTQLKGYDEGGAYDVDVTAKTKTQTPNYWSVNIDDSGSVTIG